MTSPAQLKYLDAIGIPVWVSRKLVSKNILSVQNIEVTINERDSSEPINNNNTNLDSSAQSILNSLDKEDSPQTSESENAEFPPIKKVVVDTLEKTRLPNDAKNDLTDQSIQINDKNLIFKSSLNYLFATGDKNADWMVIGHSPELYSGIGNEPFANESGDLLNNMLKAVNIEYPRKQAYLVNIYDINEDKQIKNEESLDRLNDQLLSIIDKIKPKIILIVGQVAAQNLLQTEDPLIIMRTKLHRITANKIPCVVTYYPSYLIQKPIDKRKAWDDLKLAMSTINNVC